MRALRSTPSLALPSSLHTVAGSKTTMPGRSMAAPDSAAAPTSWPITCPQRDSPQSHAAAPLGRLALRQQVTGNQYTLDQVHSPSIPRPSGSSVLLGPLHDDSSPPSRDSCQPLAKPHWRRRCETRQGGKHGGRDERLDSTDCTRYLPGYPRPTEFAAQPEVRLALESEHTLRSSAPTCGDRHQVNPRPDDSKRRRTGEGARKSGRLPPSFLRCVAADE